PRGPLRGQTRAAVRLRTCLVRRDFVRDAVFLWRIPFRVERSRREIVRANSREAPSESFAPRRVRSFLTWVLKALARDLLTALRFSFLRMFLMADRVLANLRSPRALKVSDPSPGVGRAPRRPLHFG